MQVVNVISSLYRNRLTRSHTQFYHSISISHVVEQTHSQYGMFSVSPFLLESQINVPSPPPFPRLLSPPPPLDGPLTSDMTENIAHIRMGSPIHPMHFGTTSHLETPKLHSHEPSHTNNGSHPPPIPIQTGDEWYSMTCLITPRTLSNTSPQLALQQLNLQHRQQPN